MKKALALFLLLAFLFSLAACAASGSTSAGSASPAASAAPASAGASASAAAPASPDKPVEITVAFSSLPNGLDPISEDIVSNLTAGNDIYDRLIWRDSNMEMKPAVAKTWKQIDGRTWEFEIDLKLVFQNGDPVTMDDVVFSVERLKDIPKSANIGKLIDSVTADGSKLTIKFTQENNTLLAMLTAQFILVNKAYITAGGDDAIYLKPIGTGPYKVTEFTPGTSIVMETWDGYPYEKPQIDKITYIAIPENATRYISVETGQAQYAAIVSSLEADLANKNSDLSVMKVDSLRTIWAGFNCEKAPFDNVNIRRAVIHALDRDSICAILGGRPPVQTLLFGGYPDLYMDPPDMPEFNLEKAKELLAAEGYSASNPLKIEMIYFNPDPGIELFQSSLKSIGVEVTLTQLEFSVYLSREAPGEFDMLWTSATNRGGDPLTDLDRFDYKLVGSRDVTRYNNARVQEIIAKMRVTTDKTELKALADEFATIIGQEVPSAGIFLQPLYSITSAKLSGVVLRKDQQQAFRYATYNG